MIRSQVLGRLLPLSAQAVAEADLLNRASWGWFLSCGFKFASGSTARTLKPLDSISKVESFKFRDSEEISQVCNDIWTTLRGRAVGSTNSMLKAEECRTSLFHEGHNVLKSAMTEARPSNQIRLSVPVGKGLARLLPLSVRHISTQSALAEKQQSGREGRSETGITAQEDPFDTLTDKIPVQPVSVAEGASYSIAILAGLAVAAAAAYTIFKELIVEPKEYKVYGKALDRVQRDLQIAGRLGSPIHGYGQESQNRAARQRISNRQWVDEDGVEHVEVMFHVRGPGGGGKVFSEMFKDPEDKSWKFTYLIVDVTHPTPKRFLLESYVPDVKVNLSPA